MQLNNTTQVIQSDRRIRSEHRDIRHRIQSESDNFHEKPAGSDNIFVGFSSVGFRAGFKRKRSRSFPTRNSHQIRPNLTGTDDQSLPVITGKNVILSETTPLYQTYHHFFHEFCITISFPTQNAIVCPIDLGFQCLSHHKKRIAIREN